MENYWVNIFLDGLDNPCHCLGILYCHRFAIKNKCRNSNILPVALQLLTWHQSPS
uniref:Uncharacterized protein n=1 Tax=Rhizophora mucronata TaxID=61149 RepID=A0A2P2MIV4_RHIMU